MKDFVISNYISLMIIISLLLVMFLNRRVKIPEAKAYPVIVPALFLYCVSSYINDWSSAITEDPVLRQTADFAFHVKLRTIASITSYVVLPLITLLQIFVIISGIRRKHFLAIPYVFLVIIYLTSPFTGSLVFYISDTNNFQRGPLGYTPFFVNIFYLLVLLVSSIALLAKGEQTRGILVFFIFQALAVTAYLEYRNFIAGMLDEITSLSVLLYYYYLVNVYQGKMKDALSETRIMMLQEQIRPHFIFNSLGIIRSLMKRDKDRAIESIDAFSDYLKFHVNSLKAYELIPFEKELSHSQAYLTLALSDTRRAIDIRYDLGVMDFRIPPLTLEPLVENSIKHGLPDTGGVLLIKTEQKNGQIILTVSDNGSGGSGHTARELEHLGVGLENIRKRLEYMCKGTMKITAGDTGYTVEITIPDNSPKQEGKKIENFGS